MTQVCIDTHSRSFYVLVYYENPPICSAYMSCVPRTHIRSHLALRFVHPSPTNLERYDAVMWNAYFSERCDMITKWKARFPDFNFNRRDRRAGVTALSLVVQFGVGPDMEARSRDHMVRGVSRAVDKVKALIAAGASLDVRMHTGSHIMIQVRKRRVEGDFTCVTPYPISPARANMRLLSPPPFTDSLASSLARLERTRTTTGASSSTCSLCLQRGGG